MRMGWSQFLEMTAQTKNPAIGGVFIVQAKGTYLTISLSRFNVLTLTTLCAGFALNIISAPVKGLIPLRAFLAGL